MTASNNNAQNGKLHLHYPQLTSSYICKTRPYRLMNCGAHATQICKTLC